VKGIFFLWLVGLANLWKRLEAIDLLNDRQQLHRQIRFRPGLNIMKSYNFYSPFSFLAPRQREKSGEIILEMQMSRFSLPPGEPPLLVPMSVCSRGGTNTHTGPHKVPDH
jgi:hypothetical protein